jgi:hypothetical protein
MGKDHTVCEDYALAGRPGDNSAFAIVCDGCSSSPDVDFGARVLALTAREILKSEMSSSMPRNHEELGRHIIRRADVVQAMFPSLHYKYLDATLLLAWVAGNELTCHMYGDGVFFHKIGDSTRVVHINYKVPIEGGERGAPSYLSYFLEETRKQTYVDAGGSKTMFDGLFTLEKGKEPAMTGTTTEMKPFDPVVIKAVVAPGDVIAVCSDGINSFRKANSESVMWQPIAAQYVDFKNLNGVFVQRRLSAMQLQFSKIGTTNRDDISMAAIHV